MIIAWPEIPPHYWPDTETPWRVACDRSEDGISYGIMEDFATREEADEFVEELMQETPEAWIQGPFNAVEMEPYNGL